MNFIQYYAYLILKNTIMKTHNLLEFGSTLNDLDDRLPKGRGDCFDVGIWGGCGNGCPVFQRGDCENIDDITLQYLQEDFTDEEIEELREYYSEANFQLAIMLRAKISSLRNGLIKLIKSIRLLILGCVMFITICQS